MQIKVAQKANKGAITENVVFINISGNMGSIKMIFNCYFSMSCGVKNHIRPFHTILRPPLLKIVMTKIKSF